MSAAAAAAPQAPVEGRTVNVTNVSSSSTKTSLQDYFAFVGEIESLELEADGATQKAKVTFKRTTAASSAVMLNGGVVDGSALNISLQGTAGGSALADAAPSSGAAVTQEDKPRAARVAELLAAGYTLSDDIAARAIALDKQHGLSVKFKDYLATLDKSLGAQLSKHAPGAKGDAALTEKSEAAPSGAAASAATSEKEAAALPVPGASEADVGPKTTTQVPGGAAAPKTATEHASKAVGDISKTVQARANEVLSNPQVKSHTDFVWSKLNEYYSAVINHPRIHSLWTNANQTVADIHAEAKQIAEEKKRTGNAGVAGTSAPAATAK